MAVRRPAPANAPAVHEHLRALRAAGFTGAPLPRRLSAEEGWEELEFVQGEVAAPVPLRPWWSTGDAALASVARLLRRYHEAAARVPVDRSAPWSPGLADPEGGPIVCHGDASLPNVVFRDRSACALIDFDFAAPGRPVWDLAMAARSWVPLLDAGSAAVVGLDHLDPFRRLGVLVDGYGLDRAGRRELLGALEPATAVCRAFVAERVRAGDRRHVDALAARGGWDRWDGLQAWLVENRARFAEAVGPS
jgi:aminoglycoside phosphotransferase (APT) family kinase protein